MIPLAVTARNEERALAACLESILEAVRVAESRSSLRYRVVVVLDECTDRSAEIARSFSKVETLESQGGIVEAQRAAVRPAPFVVFSDADIRVEPETLWAVGRALEEDPELQVAYPPKSPAPPQRRSLLAKALYAYNRTNGFQTPRRYFNGRFFAIRRWHVPPPGELRPGGLEALPRDRFYNYQAGIRADDIYLSRRILAEHGPRAIREVDQGRIWFRPPETFEGMYRTYKRMRMELERLAVLAPETQEVQRRFGTRGTDWQAVRRAGWLDRGLWQVFHLALWICRARYVGERFYYRHFSSHVSSQWEPIDESKQPL